MNSKTATGAMLATAVGLMFLATPVLAAGTPSGTQAAQVKCLGANDCSGTSACKTATSPGPGQNSCKGQGYLLTKSVKECKDKGGHVEKM